MSQLKVLHVHDSDMNDPRILCAAITGKKAGYEQYFCGPNMDTTLENSIFKEYKWIGFNDLARIAKPFLGSLGRYWTWYPYPRQAIWTESQFLKVIEEVKPDIIHAHNIFAAHYCLKAGVPMVLDDHEFYSIHAIAKHEGSKTIREKKIRQTKFETWSMWERELSEKCPVITVSRPIADHYFKEYHAKNVYVVPNYPSKEEVYLQDAEFKSALDASTIKSAYLGADSVTRPNPIRNISGLYDVFDGKTTGKLIRCGVTTPNNDRIRSYGMLPMKDVYEILKRECHIGLIPWKHHWFHPYCCPNKLFEYVHCGLWPIIMDDLTFVIDDLGGNCDTISSYDELKKKLQYYNDNKFELDNKRAHALSYAREHLTWERQEHKILRAYREA